MKRNLFIAILTATVAAACLSASAQAQSGPSSPSSTPSTVTPDAGLLSEQSLEAAIKALDPAYKFKPATEGSAKVYYVKISREGWNYVLQVEQCNNVIWINAELTGVLATPQNLPGGALAELLKSNFKIGPTHFALTPMTDNSGYKLFLCRLVDRHITVEQFNSSLNDLIKTVHDTHPTWSQVK